MLLDRFRRARAPTLLAAAVILPRVTALLTLPIYTRVLGPSDFGRFELLIALLALAYPVCLLGLDFSISVRYFGRDEEGRGRDLASAVVVAATCSIAGVATFAVLCWLIGPTILGSSADVAVILIAILAVPFNVLGGVLAMWLRLRFQGRAFFVAMVGGAGIGLIVGLFLVLVLDLGLVGAVVGLTAVHLTTFVLLAWGSRGSVDLRMADRRVAREIVGLGTPLVPAGVAAWAFALADRFFVAAYLGFTQLGLYAAAARIGAILMVLQFGFHAAWGPLSLRWAVQADRERRYAASLRLVATIGGAIVIAVSWLATPLLLLIAGPEYVGAASAVWPLAASVLFGSMFYVVQIGANLAKKSRRVAAVVIVAAVANTALNVTLIPAIGYLGAALATLVTYALAYAIMYVMSQRSLTLRLDFLSSTAIAVVATAVGAASMLSSAQPLILALPVVTGALLLVSSRDLLSVVARPEDEGPGAELTPRLDHTGE